MTTTNVAIVDERDPLIHYVGQWNDDGASLEFNGTTKWSAQQGSTASFTFVGTSVIVYGTVGARTAPHASMNFLLDNSITGSYTPPNDMDSDIHHEPLWTSPSIANGSHTLVITQTATQSQPAGEIYLDYLMYNTTSTSVGAYFIDDRDARIKYTGGWRLFGSDPDFQHTSQGSSSTGDSFSLEFEGKSISFYGGINNGSAGEVLNASIVIDGGPPVFFVPPIQTAATTTNNLIFNSGDLSDGNHTLVVTAENDHTVWTDYFLVTPTTSPAPERSSGASTSSSPAGGTKHTMIYIGAAIGGVVLLALIVAATFFFLRRRKRRRDFQPAHLPLSHVLPTPFSDFISTGAATLRSPFTTSHQYSALSASEANLSSTSASYSSGNTTNPRPMHGYIPSSKRDAYATRQHDLSSSSGHSADPSHHGEAPPQYSE
ncbi:hypothetical protein B0H19DRAFT_1016738 [Mycena capillaripes]|nr:hypothetical protein B0H19DRAFT_1016738 [Mycena capillaripes]